MADFIPKKQADPQLEPDKKQVEGKTKVGEEEYSQEDLQKLVGLGKLAREVEEKYNTKLDRVYPEYTKTTQKVKDYETKLAEAKKKLEEIQAQAAQTGQEWTPEQKELAKKQLQELLGGDVLTRKEYEEDREKWYSERRAGEKLLDECQEYADEIDGSDGRPKFDTKEMLEHMRETGIRNPLKAYKDKYEKELDDWKSKQISKAKTPGLFTEETTPAGKQPKKPTLTRANIKDHVREALYGAGG